MNVTKGATQLMDSIWCPLIFDCCHFSSLSKIRGFNMASGTNQFTQMSVWKIVYPKHRWRVIWKRSFYRFVFFFWWKQIEQIQIVIDQRRMMRDDFCSDGNQIDLAFFEADWKNNLNFFQYLKQVNNELWFRNKKKIIPTHVDFHFTVCSLFATPFWIPFQYSNVKIFHQNRKTAKLRNYYSIESRRTVIGI